MKKYSFRDLDPLDALNLFEAMESSNNKEQKEILYKLDEKEKIKKRKMLSDEQIKRIMNKGIKKEVDEKTFYENLVIGSCETCIKMKKCKIKEENWYNDCQEWDYFLSSQGIEISNKKKIEKFEIPVE